MPPSKTDHDGGPDLIHALIADDEPLARRVRSWLVISRAWRCISAGRRSGHRNPGAPARSGVPRLQMPKKGRPKSFRVGADRMPREIVCHRMRPIRAQSIRHTRSTTSEAVRPGRFESAISARQHFNANDNGALKSALRLVELQPSSAPRRERLMSRPAAGLFF